MNHQRREIRDKVKDILIAASTVAGDRIYPNRASTNFGKTYPLIRIWMLDESAEPLDVTTSKYKRTLQLVIEGVVQGNGDKVDDLLDQMAFEIESAMKADPALGDTAIESSLVMSEAILDDSGSPPIAKVGLQYEVKYTF